ncbi:hypothetical protein OPV22_015453 [Ensete ventricosum]|uniref:Uncharacterized protein n=1 Tax=Ensete ventricosum TaxID=4639 RepID=A0AAV8R071_ENSVE|nr:hypothetical protein OPV22_015453 [Ensete ventricosum]
MAAVGSLDISGLLLPFGLYAARERSSKFCWMHALFCLLGNMQKILCCEADGYKLNGRITSVMLLVYSGSLWLLLPWIVIVSPLHQSYQVILFSADTVLAMISVH